MSKFKSALLATAIIVLFIAAIIFLYLYPVEFVVCSIYLIAVLAVFGLWITIYKWLRKRNKNDKN